MQNLIVLELNEVIFPYVERYIAKGRLPHFKTLLHHFGYGVTDSERSYAQLEPWIQWVSAHTGLPYEAHKIFRLGDMVGSSIPQIFEVLEQRGVSVGAVSPMNAENRLRNAAFFIPDPWTRSIVTGERNLERLYEAIASAVKENAEGKLSLGYALYLVEGLIRYAAPRNLIRFLQLTVGAIGSPWRRALFLDLLLSDVFLRLWANKKPQFGVLFLNAAAHIQHHYLYSSGSYLGRHRNPSWYIPKACDPVLEVYELYDAILGQFARLDPRPRMIVVTGLSQEPYPSPVYYYRLRAHERFLGLLGVRPVDVEARMSRDFLIQFESARAALEAQKVLESVKDAKGDKFFEADNRGKSLFVTFIYGNEISEATVAYFEGGQIPALSNHVAFVALKNGHHISQGYLVDTQEAVSKSTVLPVTELFGKILAHFSRTPSGHCAAGSLLAARQTS